MKRNLALDLVAILAYGCILECAFAKSPHLRARLEGHSKQIWCLGFSHDGKLLASSGDDSLLKCGDVTVGKSVGTHDMRGNSVCSVACGPHDKMVACGMGDKAIVMWDLHFLKKPNTNIKKALKTRGFREKAGYKTSRLGIVATTCCSRTSR